MKRRFFSRKDGTTLGEDLRATFESAKHKFWDLIDKFSDEAEIIVNAMSDVNEAIQDGKPANEAIEFVLSRIPGDADERLYALIKEKLPEWIFKVQKFIDMIKGIEHDEAITADYESFRHKATSLTLQQLNGIDRVSSDTVVQTVYKLKSMD